LEGCTFVGNQFRKLEYRASSTVQYSAVQCSAVQYSAVQCSAVQYSAVQCSTVQYSAVQYCTVEVMHRDVQFFNLS
jgi:hypothetical protein